MVDPVLAQLAIPQRLSFTGRDYASIVNELVTIVRQTRSGVWSDFFETNLGQWLIEQLGLVGDLVSAGQDAAVIEIFLSSARRYESGLLFASSVGYVPAGAAAAEAILTSVAVPASLVAYGGTIPAGSQIVGSNGLTYQLLSDAVIAPGTSVISLTVTEGTSYTEQFTPSTQPSQVIIGSKFIVEDGSWSVYVGDPSNPANLWTQVDNLALLNGPSNSYQASFDGMGRLNIQFGDGSKGAIPTQTVTLPYRTCSGAAGNAAVGSISGTISAALASPGTGSVTVSFINQSVDLTTTGGTQFQSNEPQGVTSAGTIQTGATSFKPVQSGSLALTFNLLSGGGTLQLQDAGDGTMTVINNTTGIAVTAATVVYSTGAWSVTLAAAFTAGGPVTANYYNVNPADPSAVVYVGAAQGGADRETLDQMRVNVPAYIRSQNKIISLQDYDTVPLQVPGIDLIFADRYISSYQSNVISLSVWTTQTVQFTARSTDGFFSTVPYLEYTQPQSDLIGTLQDFLTPRTLASVQNLIQTPGTTWIDIYMPTVIYSSGFNKQTVHQDITAAIIAVFQASTGFVIHIADLYNAVRTVLGVKYFTIDRIALGTLSDETEVQGDVVSPTFVSGTLSSPTVLPGSVISPGTVTVSISYLNGTAITCTDDGSGNWTVTTSPLTPTGAPFVVDTTPANSFINYVTGAWKITFANTSPPLILYQPVTAVYANVTADYRINQSVTISPVGAQPADNWPPPGIPTAVPATPPYFDGVPLSAYRPGQFPISVSGITRAFASMVVTATVTATAHGYANGSSVLISGASPSVYNGLVQITVTGANTFTYTFSAASDPGAVTGTITALLINPGGGYKVGDVLTYAQIQDISTGGISSVNFYNEVYAFNDEIYYDSATGPTQITTAINLRKLSFTLTAG